jgi:hypothetical protein
MVYLVVSTICEDVKTGLSRKLKLSALLITNLRHGQLFEVAVFLGKWGRIEFVEKQTNNLYTSYVYDQMRWACCIKKMFQNCVCSEVSISF